MMTKVEANEWAQEVCNHGTGIDRHLYRRYNTIGLEADKYWDDPTFTLGIEYGILIAVQKIYEGLSGADSER